MSTSRRSSDRGAATDTDILLAITIGLCAVALGWGLGWQHFSWVVYLACLVVMVQALLDLLNWVMRDEPLSPMILVWTTAALAVLVWMLVEEHYLPALVMLTIPPWLAILILLGGRLHVHYLKWAAAKGGTRAQYRYAQLLYYGKGVPEDHQQAIHWYHQAAENRYRPAEQKLARIYERGDGVPRNQRLADQWYLRAERSRHRTRR
jgi:hypothetical protein